MKKYEKDIVRSIEMSNSIGVQEFSAYIDSFGSDILETLYGYINERLDRYVGEDDIDNLDIAFEYLERVLLNTEYDRKLSNYRIRKLNQKIYRHHSGYIGGMKEVKAKDMIARKPETVIELAVKGMLPKNALGREMIKKLKVYSGAEHEHAAQKPEKLEIKA